MEGAACRVAMLICAEGAATTGYDTWCVGATGVVAKGFGKVCADFGGGAGDLFGVAGDHAAADGRKVGEATIGTPACRVEATEVAAARAAVAEGEAVWGVAFTKKGGGSGDLGREIGNLLLDVTAS